MIGKQVAKSGMVGLFHQSLKQEKTAKQSLSVGYICYIKQWARYWQLSTGHLSQDQDQDTGSQDRDTNKKAQLSLTNPRDACEKFARFT